MINDKTYSLQVRYFDVRCKGQFLSYKEQVRAAAVRIFSPKLCVEMCYEDVSFVQVAEICLSICILNWSWSLMKFVPNRKSMTYTVPFFKKHKNLSASTINVEYCFLFLNRSVVKNRMRCWSSQMWWRSFRTSGVR